MAVAPVLQCVQVCFALLLFLSHCCKCSISPCFPSYFNLATALLLLECSTLYFCCCSHAQLGKGPRPRHPSLCSCHFQSILEHPCLGVLLWTSLLGQPSLPGPIAVPARGSEPEVHSPSPEGCWVKDGCVNGSRGWFPLGTPSPCSSAPGPCWLCRAPRRKEVMSLAVVTRRVSSSCQLCASSAARMEAATSGTWSRHLRRAAMAPAQTPALVKLPCPSLRLEWLPGREQAGPLWKGHTGRAVQQCRETEARIRHQH